MLDGEGFAPTLLPIEGAREAVFIVFGATQSHCIPSWSRLWYEWMSNPGENMSRLSWLQKLYWTRFGKPSEERELFKFLITHPIRSLLEIGVGDGARMQRFAKLVQLADGVEQLRYIGIDEFESATDGGRHLRLKEAHQLSSLLGFKASLIPGDHASAIPRVAHKMGACDVIVVDGGLDPAAPSSGVVGTWLNRLAHDHSVVFACSQPGGTMQRVNLGEIALPPVRQAA
jgi:hypothetical protein